MIRRLVVVVPLVAAAVVVAAPGVPAAGPGLFGFRSRMRAPAPTRTYRSYSVSPGAVAVPEATPGAESGAAVIGPAPATPRPRKQVPSYMRADSKARGRFGP